MNRSAPNLVRLLEIMDKLRGEGGCPWDREQDHRTLKKYALEECYELLDAIDSGSEDELREELGDLLLQVVFHARIASERKAFDFDAVAERICSKLIARHPHVFGDRKVSGAEEVLDNWETLKLAEKANGGGKEQRSRFDGLPRALPALLMTVRIREKSRSVPEVEALLERLAQTPSRETIAEFLEAAALLADRWGLNPEEELRRRNNKRITDHDATSGKEGILKK